MANTSKVPVVSSLIIIAVILLVVFYANPRSQRVETVNAETLQIQNQLSALQSELAELQDIQSSIPADDTGKQNLLAAVPVELNEDELINDIYKLAGNNNISFDSITFSLNNELSADINAHIVGVSASFFGSYNDLNSFLRSLEALRRKIHVKSISVQMQEQSENSQGLNANFNLNMEAYYQGIVK